MIPNLTAQTPARHLYIDHSRDGPKTLAFVAFLLFRIMGPVPRMANLNIYRNS